MLSKRIIEENRLKHHRGSAEHLYVYSDDDAQEFQEKPLYDIVLFCIRDSIQYAAKKPDNTSDSCRGKCKKQSVQHPAKVHTVVLLPQRAYIGCQFSKYIHQLKTFLIESPLPLLQTAEAAGSRLIICHFGVDTYRLVHEIVEIVLCHF